MEASWILFLISIVCGLLSLLSMTSNLWPKVSAERSNSPPDIWTSDLRNFAIAQVIFFGLGFIAVIVAGFHALN